MSRISIQPDRWEHCTMLFFTTPEQLVSDKAVDVKIKRVVLVIFHWIVKILTLGIFTQHCIDKRCIVESRMRNDMMRSIQKTVGGLIYDALKEPENGLHKLRVELDKIDGISENVKDFIISLLPTEKVNDKIDKYVEKIMDRFYDILIRPNKILDDVEDLTPLENTDRDELFRLVKNDMLGNMGWDF